MSGMGDSLDMVIPSYASCAICLAGGMVGVKGTSSDLYCVGHFARAGQGQRVELFRLSVRVLGRIGYCRDL